MQRYRSFFWPAVVILIGLVWLLVDIGQVPVDRLILLVNLWPVVLIVVGLELIVRRSLHGAVGDLAAALIVLLAAAGSVAYIAVSPSPTATHTLDVSAPAANLQQASLQVNAGSATITIREGSDLGSDLYRAHIEYPGPKPEVTVDGSGAVRISQRSTYPFGIDNGHFTLDAQLNPDIAWRIVENTGGSTDRIEVPHLKATAITVNTGASREEMTLGPASGVVPIEINGGALTVTIHRASGTEVRASVNGGAIHLNADSRSSNAVGSLTFETPGFASASDAYRIAVNGGACSVTLDTGT